MKLLFATLVVGTFMISPTVVLGRKFQFGTSPQRGGSRSLFDDNRQRFQRVKHGDQRKIPVFKRSPH